MALEAFYGLHGLTQANMLLRFPGVYTPGSVQVISNGGLGGTKPSIRCWAQSMDMRVCQNRLTEHWFGGRFRSQGTGSGGWIDVLIGMDHVTGHQLWKLQFDITSGFWRWYHPYSGSAVMSSLTFNFRSGDWMWWDIYYLASTTVGQLEFWLNGIKFIEVIPADGWNTLPAPSVGVSQVYFGGGGHIATEFDCLYMFSTTGTRNNARPLKQLAVSRVAHDADVVTDLTPSTGGSNVAMISEEFPDHATYNSGDTVGQRDTFSLVAPDIDATNDILGMARYTQAKKDGDGGRAVRSLLINGTDELESTDLVLASAVSEVRMFTESIPGTTDPIPDAAAIGAMQVGYEITI